MAESMAFGVIVDLETTGLNPLKDEIIEIGILGFTYGNDNKPVVTTAYGALEDPGKPIPEEIIKLTGITDDQVKGQSIDWGNVKEILGKADIVVAHNAKFDRGFLEQRVEIASVNINWACSQSHIDWRAMGYKTSALNYLAADHGFVNPFAHRAIFDCATTFKIIENHVDAMVARSQQKEIEIKAFGSPFETKDALKSRNYRWNPEERVWHKTITENDLEEERVFLREEIYGGNTKHEEVAVD
jgi:DNA polymerase III subunit epsilon